MKVKNYTNGDFGGVSYKQGDFHTVGFSGTKVSKPTSSMGGNFFEDAFKTIFGEAGAQQVATTAQQAATSVVTNVVGTKLATNAEAKQGVVDTVRASVAQIYQDNKVIVWTVGGGFALLAGLGLYNTFKKK